MHDTEFSVIVGDVMGSASGCYVVEDFLGEGSFGKVARCHKTATNEKVAVKITKNHPELISQARQETAMLTYLRVLDPDVCGIVRWMGTFQHGPHICLEFELLDKSLRDLIMESEDCTLPLWQIKIILEQLATALDYLGTVGIIHGDLKPDNIMLTGEANKVKLIDFGLSCHVSHAEVGIELQTMCYKSPEIMLGLPFNELIDMWSLGCVVAELLIGFQIYPGETEYAMLRYIIETQGNLPDAMLEHGIDTPLWFTKGSGESGVWRMKEFDWLPRYRTVSSLEELVDVYQKVGNVPGQPIPPSFTDLLKRMLQLEANQRITPRALLQHPFMCDPTASCGEWRDEDLTVTPSLRSVSSTPTSLCDPTASCDEWTVEDLTVTPTNLRSVSSTPPHLTGTPKIRSVSSTPTSLCDPTASCDEWTVEDLTVTPTNLRRTIRIDLATLCEEGRVEDISVTAEIHSTSSTPTASCEVAMETVEVQPAVADIQLEVTQKTKKKKKSRAKRFFQRVVKTIRRCCCCLPSDVLD